MAVGEADVHACEGLDVRRLIQTADINRCHADVRDQAGDGLLRAFVIAAEDEVCRRIQLRGRVEHGHEGGVERLHNLRARRQLGHAASERTELPVDVIGGVDQDLAVKWTRGLEGVVDFSRLNREQDDVSMSRDVGDGVVPSSGTYVVSSLLPEPGQRAADTALPD